MTAANWIAMVALIFSALSIVVSFAYFFGGLTRSVKSLEAAVARNSKLTGANAKKFVDDVLKNEDK